MNADMAWPHATPAEWQEIQARLIEEIEAHGF
jgi:hypothetical protein